MRRLAVILLLGVASLLGAPYPNTALYKEFGPRTWIAGYSHWFRIKPSWSFDFTCDPATTYCTSSQYTPANGVFGNVTSSGTLPTPLYGFYGGKWAPYVICQATGTNFKICRNDGSGLVETILNAGNGTHTFLMDSSVLGQHIFIDNINGSGFPAGTTLTFNAPNTNGCSVRNGPDYDVATGKFYIYRGGNTLCLKVTVPATAVGSYTPSLTFCETGTSQNCGIYNLGPVSVINLPNPGYADPLPAELTPITGTAAVYRDLMLNNDGNRRGGGFWCDPATGITNPPSMSFGVDQQIWYYDGPKNFFDQAVFLQDPRWTTCGENIASQYRDYITANNGQIPLYHQFPQSLLLAVSRLAKWDGRYIAALRQLRTHNEIVLYGPSAYPNWDREHAYAMDISTGLWRYLNQPPPYIEDLADSLISTALYQLETSSYQTFISGLVMDALIRYWEMSKDPRVPYIVRRYIDDIYSHLENTTTWRTWYIAAPNGPYCGTTNTWFNSDPGVGCQLYSTFPLGGSIDTQQLSNLHAQAAAWYFRITGMTAYRDYADNWVTKSQIQCCYLGKEYSQQFRHFYEYLRWRTGR